jgi:hemoglobin-like flavoprotein
MNPGSTEAVRSVLGLLERLSSRERENALVERFYDRFFDENPEVVPLFGRYALAEREEMLRETTKSLLGWCERESWLEGNLRALGASHVEYGVEPEMYPPFVSAFVAAVGEVLDRPLAPEEEKHLTEALESVCAVMSAA